MQPGDDDELPWQEEAGRRLPDRFYCLACWHAGELSELVPFKRRGSSEPGYQCPNCGRKD